MDTIYYVATSLDGYIADADGGVSWLDDLGIDQTNTGYEAFYARVDGLMMGRGTYDFILEYGKWPYGDQPCWIFSSRDIEVLDGCDRQAETSLEGAVARAEALGLQSVWVVGGGKLAAALMEAGLLTHLNVSVMPILLGGGIRLVDSLGAPVRLVQESAAARAGFCSVVYRVA